MGSMRPHRLISVGSILADVRVEAPHLPARGGDVLGSAATVTAGGGFNILAAAARQGMPTMYAGRHGAGPYGECIRAALARSLRLNPHKVESFESLEQIFAFKKCPCEYFGNSSRIT